MGGGNYMIGIINSKLMNLYYHTINPEVGEALAEVKKTHVANLPIRVPNPNDKMSIQRRDRLVELVSQMLLSQQQLNDAKSPQDRSVLNQRIEIIDRQIDRLVYDIYDLNESEIAIVEHQQ